jgi:hypothetical protein
MNTLGHSIRRLTGIPAETQEVLEQSSRPIDDGLGCMRGLVFVFLFNAALVIMSAAVWALWRWLR